MPWSGQELFLEAQKRGPLSDGTYVDALAKAKRLAGPEASTPRSRRSTWTRCSQPAAVAGYPSITVPTGFVHGLPVGIVLFGAK